MLRRRLLLAALGTGFGTALAGSAHALAIEPGFCRDVRHYRPALPAGFGLRVAVINDIQAGGAHTPPRRVVGVV